MKKINQHILLFILSINSFFIQGQEVSISNKELLAKQINELKVNRDFIAKSNCNQAEEQRIVKQYESDFNKLIESLALAQHLISVSNAVAADNTIFNHAIAKHEGVEKLSTKEVIGKSRYPQLNFSYNNTKIEVRYRNNFKGNPGLISLKVDYPDNIQIYLDFTTFYQAMFHVYKKENYANGEPHLIKKIHLMFDPFEIGKINYLFVYYNEVERYRLRLDKYEEKEKVSDYQYKIHNKFRYETYCYDGNDQWITATQTGNDIEIKPSTYLLWYKGFIGKYPIKMMLKRGFNKETNDTRILDMAYGYDSKKKWIFPQNLWEPQDGIYCYEKGEDSPEWEVNFEYNQVLKGDWDNQNGTTLPITLTPIAKEFPKFIFKAGIEEELTSTGEVQSKIVRGISIYKNDKKIQEINNEDGSSLDYFELGYVDINYDGYLDLFINDKLYLYHPTSKKFTVTDEDEYYRYLAELGQYNLFDKSFISQMNRAMLEYRAINGKLTPYHSSSYYPNADGDMVILEEKYVNGKWVTISEEIEKMEEDENEPIDANANVVNSKNYTLNIDLTVNDGSLLFSPDFYNNTGQKQTFKQPAKLFTEVTDAHNKTHRQFLYNVELTGKEGIDYIDDSYITFNGKVYFYESTSNLIPLFPLDLINGDYTFQLVLEHPLFGKVKSKSQTIQLPFQLKTDSTIKHFIGSINDKVKGSIYFKVNDKKVIGTFNNVKTGKHINLKGTYIHGVFGVDTVNLEEHEKNDELSGYFEGTITNLKGEHEGIYKGFWISPNKEIRVPFTFKKQ